MRTRGFKEKFPGGGPKGKLHLGGEKKKKTPGLIVDPNNSGSKRAENFFGLWQLPFSSRNS